VTRESGSVPVEVRPAVDPQGVPGVLLQLPDGWVVMKPDGARKVGAMLINTADEVESHEPG